MAANQKKPKQTKHKTKQTNKQTKTQWTRCAIEAEFLNEGMMYSF